MDTQKPWYQSKTVWGGLIAAMAPLVRMAGIDIDPGMQGELADAAATLAGALGGLLAIYGRLSATSAIAGR